MAAKSKKLLNSQEGVFLPLPSRDHVDVLVQGQQIVEEDPRWEVLPQGAPPILHAEAREVQVGKLICPLIEVSFDVVDSGPNSWCTAGWRAP